MVDSLLFQALFSMGQFVGDGLPPPPPPDPAPLAVPAERGAGVALPAIGAAPEPMPKPRLPMRLPPPPLTVAEPPAALPAVPVAAPVPVKADEPKPAAPADDKPAAKADEPAKPVEITAALLPPPKPPEPSAAPPVAAAAAADRWALMKSLQGTMYGAALDDNRMYLYGWFNGSANTSTAAQNNAPVTWIDRPNNFLFQQAWVRLGRSVVTSGTTMPTFGFQLDFLFGSDYRYTMPRGLWNSQLLNSAWDPATDPSGTKYQRLYGVDLVQQYVNAYIPNLFRGTEIRIGRFYTPWGVESIEAISTPLITHSYAFNWSPPFTHCGAAAYITFDPEWSAVLMAVNGNDVYWGDPATEWRFVGNVKWTQPGGKNTVTLAASIGRGKFDDGEKFDVPGVETIDEAGGRTNMNAFDIVWTHLLNPRLAYNLEAIYGYQTNVPAIYNSKGYGTAHWYAIAHYLFWTISPQLTGILRFENFDDMQGQRTTVDAVYTSVTTGLVYRPIKDVILRSELRYDIASHGRPFDNGTNNQLFVAAVDFTVRW